MLSVSHSFVILFCSLELANEELSSVFVVHYSLNACSTPTHTISKAIELIYVCARKINDVKSETEREREIKMKKKKKRNSAPKPCGNGI